jgi:hypothetical protein
MANSAQISTGVDMNITIVLGLAAILILLGVLIGHGLNGRTYIARDKRQAQKQFELNIRADQLQALMLDRRHGHLTSPPETRDRSPDDSVSPSRSG